MGHLMVRRLFGVGPIGAGITLILLAAAIRVDRALGHPEILRYGSLMRMLGVLLICAGLALLFWSMYTLRSWWADNRLCTTGPFRWFRHPMYAAWITFVSLGIAFYLNSWILLAWVILLHPVWHRLVIHEEKMMSERFEDEYRAYAEQTGRFIPRLWNPRHS